MDPSDQHEQPEKMHDNESSNDAEGIENKPLTEAKVKVIDAAHAFVVIVFGFGLFYLILLPFESQPFALVDAFFDNPFEGGSCHLAGIISAIGALALWQAGEGYLWSKYGSEYGEVRERIAKREAEEAEAEKEKKEKYTMRTKKKVFFGLWERELTPPERLLELARSAAYSGDHDTAQGIIDGFRGLSSEGVSRDSKKPSLVDYLEAATTVRCTHCDRPTEGGPEKGTYLCSPCGFLFDSRGNTI